MQSARSSRSPPPIATRCQRTLTALLLGASFIPGCFARKPGDDRTPRDADVAVDLRLVQPAHGAAVTRRRPIVRWRSSVPSPAWSVEFCADARCERVLQRMSTADLTAAPRDDLPTGLVFWRVSEPTRVGVASAVRWFDVPRGLPAAAPPGVGAVTSPVHFDADGDGRVEFLDSDGTLRRADGDASVVARLALGDATHFVAAGDVDGDGVPDLAALAGTPAPATPAVVIWRGPVRGEAVAPTWSVPIPEDFGTNVSRTRAFALTAGDLDGDGFRDLVASSVGFQQIRGQVYVFPGGPGGPSASDILTLASPRGLESSFRALDAADLDGDGCDELLASAPGRTFLASGVSLVYRGTPAGLDPLPVWSNARAAGDNDGLGAAGTFADVNGDGDLDVVLTAPSARGRGCVYTFPWLRDARTVASDPSSAACGDGVEVLGHFGLGLALGDFDADGHADAVVSGDVAERGLLSLARGERGGLGEGALSRLADGGLAFGVARLASTDLDGDGYTDLVVENDARGVLRLLGSPAGLRPIGGR